MVAAAGLSRLESLHGRQVFDLVAGCSQSLSLHGREAFAVAQSFTFPELDSGSGLPQRSSWFLIVGLR